MGRARGHGKILRVFASFGFGMRLTPKAPWKLETDVRVEDNGAGFLVYPFSDFGREWLERDKNLPTGSQRLGDIVLVQPDCILPLVARMIEDDLWVVWR